MSRTLETKEQILNLLRQKKKNVTELSAELGLSKSTISQHLSELEQLGAVRPMDNSFFKRTKYFELNPESSSYVTQSRGKEIMIKIAIGALILLGVIVVIHPFIYIPTAPAEAIVQTTSTSSVPEIQHSTYNALIQAIGVLIIIIGLIAIYLRYVHRGNRRKTAR